jgi:hypothetical protein
MIEKASDQKNWMRLRSYFAKCRTDLREMLHRPRAPDRSAYSIPAASRFWVADRAAFGLRVRSKRTILENKPVVHFRFFWASNHSSKRELRQISDKNENKTGDA